jgi:hypothetical protein
MRTVLLVACIVSASLLVPIQALGAERGAAGAVLIDLVSGAGKLDNATTFSVSALAYLVGTHQSNSGSLVLNGVATDCVIDSVAADCSEATLLCEDVFHQVVAGVPGVSHGSLDGVAVVKGNIRQFCKH